MKQGAAIIIAATLAVACNTTTELNVRTEFSRETSFGQLESFRMATDYPSGVDYQRYPRQEKIAREVIREELESRGYVRATDGPTDFRVEFEVIFRGHKERLSRSSEVRPESSEAALTGYSRSATMIIRMLDPATGRRLWEGTVSGFKIDPFKSREDLRRAAWRLLAEWPPIRS